MDERWRRLKVYMKWLEDSGKGNEPLTPGWLYMLMKIIDEEIERDRPIEEEE